MISLLQILNEIEIKPLSKREILIQKVKYSPKLNLRIGKFDVDKGQQGFELNWDEALRKKLLSLTTRNRVMELFNILEIQPNKVYVGWYFNNEYNSINNRSTYIIGHINDEPILVAQRQTQTASAGRLYVYSKYAKAELNFVLNRHDKTIQKYNNEFIRSHNHNDYLQNKNGMTRDYRTWMNSISKEESSKENILKALKIPN